MVDTLRRLSMSLAAMPVRSQRITTRDDASVDVKALVEYKVVDAQTSVTAIDNVETAIDQIVQTTLRTLIAGSTLAETLSETDQISREVRRVLDAVTVTWGVELSRFELKDVQQPKP